MDTLSVAVFSLQPMRVMRRWRARIYVVTNGSWLYTKRVSEISANLVFKFPGITIKRSLILGYVQLINHQNKIIGELDTEFERHVIVSDEYIITISIPL